MSLHSAQIEKLAKENHTHTTLSRRREREGVGEGGRHINGTIVSAARGLGQGRCTYLPPGVPIPSGARVLGPVQGFFGRIRVRWVIDMPGPVPLRTMNPRSRMDFVFLSRPARPQRSFVPVSLSLFMYVPLSLWSTHFLDLLTLRPSES